MMNIKKGNSRIVFVGKSFVVKFPIIRIRKGFRHLVHIIKSGRLCRDLAFDTDIKGTIKFFFFNGIVENWQEYKFSCQNPDMQILAKTTFSFFGLINIQERFHHFDMSGEEIWGKLLDMLLKHVELGLIMRAGHHLTDARNFGLHEGKIKVLDYGNKNLRKILQVCGNNLYDDFTL